MGKGLDGRSSFFRRNSLRAVSDFVRALGADVGARSHSSVCGGADCVLVACTDCAQWRCLHPAVSPHIRATSILDTLTYLFTYLITHLLTYLLTRLLTPWSRLLFETLTGSQLVMKFPAFYGTRRFITSFTSARHLYLSRASSIQSIPPLPKDPS